MDCAIHYSCMCTGETVTMMIYMTMENLIPCTCVRSAKSWGIAADLEDTDEDLKD